MRIGQLCRFVVAIWAVVISDMAGVPKVEARPGDLDPAFGLNGTVTTAVTDYWFSAITQLFLDDDERIIAGGIGAGAVLARYDANGVLDLSFGTGGVTRDPRLYYAYPPPFARASDGRLYTAGFGNPEGGDPLLLRYDADGHPDESFGTEGAVDIDLVAGALVARDDGTLLIAGECSWPFGGAGLRRMGADGAPDPSFASYCSYSDETFLALRVWTDGRMTAAGLRRYDRVVIGHFLPNGGLDASFGAHAFVVTAAPFSAILVAIQSDGRVVTVDDGSEGVIHLARYTADGSLDPTFGTNGIATVVAGPWGYGSFIQALAVQSDGKILIAGTAQVIPENDNDLVVGRLRTNGTVDPTFGTNGFVTTDVHASPEFDEIAYALLELPDGKILAGGIASESETRGPLAMARFLGDACGDGVVSDGEACDAGSANGTASSCCAADCSLHSSETVCRSIASACDVEERCDGTTPNCPVDAQQADGAACTSGDACVADEHCHAGACVGSPIVCSSCLSCEPMVGCVFTPRYDCAAAASPARAILDIRSAPTPRRDRVEFTWTAGAPLLTADLGNPLDTSGYTLCVYDHGDRLQLRLAATAPAGTTCGNRACWRRIGDGWRYRDPAAAGDGVFALDASPRRGRLKFTGRGENLHLPILPLAPPATVELRVTGGGCWQATAEGAGVLRNDATRFRGSAP